MQLKLVLGLGLFSILPLAAQDALSCIANAALTPVVRSGGLSEMVGEIVFTCSGAQAPAGTTPTFDIQVSYNGPVTSRVLNPTYQTTEALLLVDEPGSAYLSGAPQVACDSLGATTVPGTPCNVHPGVLVGTNSIKWTGIPLYPDAGRSLRVLRITNQRVSTKDLLPGEFIPATVNATVSVLGQDAPTPVNSQVVLAFVMAPLQLSIRNAANDTQLPDGVHYDRCCSVNPDLLTIPAGANLTETVSFVARVGESFGTTAMRQSIGETWPTADAPVVVPTPQNEIGWLYNSESGFYNPAFPSSPDGLDRAGLASQGSRFYLRFYNVPSGVVLYSGLYSVGSTAADSPVRRIVNEEGAFAATSATVLTAGPYAPMVEVGPGVYEAFYQVTEFGAHPGMISNYDIPIAVGYNSATVAPGAAQLEVGMAPRSTSEDPANQTAPRFAVPVHPLTAHAFDLTGSSTGSVAVEAVKDASPMTASFTVQGAAGCQPGSYQTPKTFDWAVGLACTVTFPDEAIPVYTGARYHRTGWSGGPAGSSQTITVVSGNRSYIMTYVYEIQVKAAVNPANCGTNTFQGGVTQLWMPPSGGAVTATAAVTPGSSCSFQGFSSTDTLGMIPSNPYTYQFIRNPTTIVANFSPGVPRFALSTYSKSGPANARSFNIVLRNSGTASATQPNITAATIVQSSGAPCSPSAQIVSPLPVAGPATLAPAATATYPLQLDFSGCTNQPIATPFRLTFTVTPSNGAPQTIAITTAR